MRTESRALAEGVARAVASLGFSTPSRAHDASLDPTSFVTDLAGVDPVLLRVGEVLGEGDGVHGPAPRDGRWLRLTPGQRRVDACPLLGGACRAVDVDAIVEERLEEWCCDAPRCERTRQRHTLRLRLAGEDASTELVVYEGTDGLVAAAIAASLRRCLGLASVHDESPFGVGSEGASSMPEPLPALTALEVAAFALRCEAGRWVVRERGTPGPRAALPGELALLGVIVSLAVASAIAAQGAWQEGDRERAAILGACALVAAIASYAVLHIALHSARYRAEGAPILFAYRDRLVPSPWVSRAGEVGLAPEGRFGAGLPSAEIDAVELVEDGEVHVLLCQGAHGPMELARFDSPGLGAVWRAVVTRLLAETRHVALLLLLLGLLGASAACGPTVPRQTGVVGPSSSAGDSGATSAATSATPLRAPASAGVPASSASSPAQAASAAATSVGTNLAPVGPRVPLAMIEDDVPRALAEGKRTGKPVLVEVWAAWCHTCLSMKSYVLPDPAIAALGERLVFAAVDSEDEANAAFLEKHRVGVWPTLFVLAPENGAVLGIWEGSASVDELRSFLIATADARGALADPALLRLVEGNRAQAAGDCKTAAERYRAALDAGGASWSRRGEAVKGLVYCLHRQGLEEACVDTAMPELATLGGTSAPVDVASTVLDCAESLPGARAAEARRLATARVEAWVASPPPGASPDDQADAFSVLGAGLRSVGRGSEAGLLLARQIALLERAAAEAPDVEAAATFDYARMNAYLATGQGERAVALLTQRTSEMPKNYEPWARLAQALTSLGRHDEALRAIGEALALVRGPRRVRYLTMQADLHARLGERAREREVVRELVRAYEAMPASAKRNPANASGLAAAKRRLQSLW